jgi:hypothetical protein
MSSSAIREKLYDYIRVADDKKVKAIYNLLQEDIEEAVEWWQDISVIQELDSRYNNWKSGKEKAYSIKETDSYIQQLKKNAVKK